MLFRSELSYMVHVALEVCLESEPKTWSEFKSQTNGKSFIDKGTLDIEG